MTSYKYEVRLDNGIMASLNLVPAMGRGWDVSICFGSPRSGEIWFAMHVLSPARFRRI